MITLPPSTRISLVLGGAVLVATLVTLPDAVPIAVKALLPAIGAVLTGLAILRGANDARVASDKRVAEAEAAVSAQSKTVSEVRHDIRGYLSPALLNADRLSTHPDATVRRAAETMILAIERIEARLRDG